MELDDVRGLGRGWKEQACIKKRGAEILRRREAEGRGGREGQMSRIGRRWGRGRNILVASPSEAVANV